MVNMDLHTAIKNSCCYFQIFLTKGVFHNEYFLQESPSVGVSELSPGFAGQEWRAPCSVCLILRWYFSGRETAFLIAVFLASSSYGSWELPARVWMASFLTSIPFVRWIEELFPSCMEEEQICLPLWDLTFNTFLEEENCIAPQKLEHTK